MQPKFVAAQEMLLKQETQQTFVKWIARFYYFRHLYSAGSVMCIAYNNYIRCPSIWATLSALLINILLGSFQLFLHSDQPLWGWNNPVQQCLPVRGRLRYPRRRQRAASRTDGPGVARPTTSGSIITQSTSFSALASANSSDRVLHQAQQHHADASACR